MSRYIPPALLAHLQQPDTTTCRLLKITPVSGAPFGFTTLDRDVSYDDGTDSSGELNYVATNGFDPSAIAADIGYSVDNSEGYALISDDVPGITLEMIEAGDLDDATWVCYLVNYEDLSMGHMILDGGDLGEVRTRYGMVWMPELLSHIVRLRQPIGHVDSITCRAEFGTPANSQTGCGIDADALWVSGSVTAVGAESDRVFDISLDSPSSLLANPAPGRIRWLTGDNAGNRLSWVESLENDTVELAEPTRRPVQVGDTFEIRPDCRKRYLQDCIGIYNNGLNFKGEPHIPIGDASQVQTPGAQLPGAGGYIGRAVEDSSGS